MINYKFLLAASLLVAVAATAHAQSCVGKSVEVKGTGMKTAKPVNESVAFDQDGVQQHFDSLNPITDFRPNTKSTFTCVDSRGEVNELGTPGGDFAELAAAIQVYLDQTKQPVTDATVAAIFKAFVESNTDAERPFYYHSSDEKLKKIFAHLAEDGVKPKPTVFPENMPTDADTKDAWLKALSTGKNQGCGHVRLMIDQFADFSMPSADVPQALIRAFFNYWWGTPVGSPQRQRVKFQIVQGPLDGHAVAIVGSTGGCEGYSPALPPSHDGSQLFMYHATAVDDFRKNVLTPFFVNYAKSTGKTLDKTKYYNALKSLQAKQLTAVLTYLAPANELPIWGVTVKAGAGSGDEVAGREAPANLRPDLANPASVAAAKPSIKKP